MAARDRYSRKLECAMCGNAGYAEVSEDDMPTRAHPDFTVDSLPRGHVFKFQQKTVYAAGGEPRR